MLTLPKVKKNVKGGFSRMEKVQRVIAAAALAFGVGLANLPVDEVHAAAPQSTALSGTRPKSDGALLLAPAGQVKTIVAEHQSHSSHSSHYSHYSGR